MVKLFFYFSIGTLFLGGCASQKITKQLPLKSGNYLIKTPGRQPLKSYIHIEDDSITVFEAKADGSFGLPVPLSNNSLVIDRSFDIDVLTIPFKYRPPALYRLPSSDLPRQLTADFNGNVFMGFRADRYRTHLINTPYGIEKDIRHKAFTAGLFGGIGTTFVSQWTTNDPNFSDEYQGLILSHGVSTMIGIDNLTVGLAVGWDFLTDRDKHIWIYQNKPWIGLALSLNIN